MNDDLESTLRKALRPTSPSDDFDRRLQARLAASGSAPGRGARRAWRRPWPFAAAGRWWLAAGMAAALLLAVGVQHRVLEERDRAKGREARRQVMQALRVTNDKLDLAYRVLKDQPTIGNRGSGA